MKALGQFLAFTIILFLQIDSGWSLCKMPTAWLGSWYQRGMNSLLEITIDRIQTKGLCIDALPAQQYYLFIDRLTRCTRCLVFIQRHINLLQYRESECSDFDDLSNITSCPNMIAPDAALYTLHRNDSKPQLCPIQPPFILTNLIKDSTVCQQSTASLSYINECAYDYQFHLHLAPCLSYQPVVDLQFICVGTWIEDFHTYFVARIASHSSKRQRNPKHNQYACFRFLTKQKSSSSLMLSMATDDSCRDLYSKQMSTVMTLSWKNPLITNVSTDFCVFPNKLQYFDWYTINETIQMVVKNTNIELLGLQTRFYCQEMIGLEKFKSIYRIRTLTNCEVKEECLQIIQRANNVIELYTSPLSSQNNCRDLHHENNHLYLTFFTKSSTVSSSCPGYIHDILFDSGVNFNFNQKSFHISIDCDNKDKLIMSPKSTKLALQPVNELNTCLASWRSDSDSLMTYFIAQSKVSNKIYCLKFQVTDRIIVRNNKNECLFSNEDNHEVSPVHSIYLEEYCSHSRKLMPRFVLLLIAICISLNGIT